MPIIKGWKNGMDNVHEDHELGDDTLRRAVNVDILDSGKVRRRRGSELAEALSGAHSAWDDGNDNAYLVVGNVLKKVLPGAALQTVGNVAAGNNHLSYVLVHDAIYFTCKSACGRIRNDIIERWGVEVPASPAILSETLGNLLPGTYSVAVTYLLADGRESGASIFSTIELENGGGVAITALPVPLDGAITRKRIYISTASGEVLYMAVELDAADQFAVINVPATGSELRTKYLSPLPFGVGIAFANGRIFVIDAADPRLVKYSLALQYDHTDKREKYYLFPEPCLVIAGTKSGLYVATATKTYYIANAGTESPSVFSFDFGAIAETARMIPKTQEYIWMSERGAVIGHDGGQPEILSGDSVVPGGMINAASMVRENDGLTQFVAVGNATDANRLQAGSFAEAEITRREGT
jgi:hypothetical protein